MNDVIRQDISLKSRKDLDITGVKKVYSLDENEFVLETTLGKMKVGGSNLEMTQLDIEKGILIITGNINLIEYSDNIKTKSNKSSFVTKLFK